MQCIWAQVWYKLKYFSIMFDSGLTYAWIQHISLLAHIPELMKLLLLRNLFDFVQYKCTKCVPLMPPSKFGPCQSCYDTRTAAHFANPPRLRLTFSVISYISLEWNSLLISLCCHITNHVYFCRCNVLAFVV